MRQKGERSNIILNEFDMLILETIIDSNKDVAIMEMQKKLNITHASLNRHLKWLKEIKIINTTQLPKTRRTILSVTKDGRTIYKILKNNISKDSYKTKL